MPIWAAVIAVAVVYIGRSAIRGWDFRPDLPIDAVLLVVFLALIGLSMLPRDPREG